MRLLEVLKRRAFEFKDTPQIGRTHGIHAEPTSFGLVWALWYSEMQREPASGSSRHGRPSLSARSAERSELLLILIRSVEERVCEKLGLEGGGCFDAGHSARPLCRISLHACDHRIHSGKDRSAGTALAADRGPRGTGGVQERSEGLVRDAAQAESDPLGTHLRNGADGAGKSRSSASKMSLSGMNGDISHSSAERIVLPDSSATLDYMLAKTTSLLDTLVVYPENMLKNLNLTRGLGFQRTTTARSDAKRRFARGRLCLDAAKRDEGLGRGRRLSGPDNRKTRTSPQNFRPKKLPAFLISNITCVM